MSTDERDLVWREIGRIGTCMVVTLDGREITARPMVGIADREANRVWLIAHRNDNLEAAMAADSRVCLTYADVAANIFVSLSGHAEAVNDRTRMRALWTASLDAWFDDGADDEQAVLIAVIPETAEVWDEPNADIVAALEMLTATAVEAQPPIGENRKIRMSRRR